MRWSKGHSGYMFTVLLTVVAGTLVMGSQSYGQGPGQRLRGPRETPPAAQQLSQQPFFVPAAAPAGATLPGALPAGPPPVSMLQQPAQTAKIVFTDNNLVIHAENSSLSEILKQFSEKSGMQISGLGNDERVFGNFGPGSPRDVLADLLNGTAYNQVLLGDLHNGAPRELILTPTTHGEVASPAVQSQAAATVDEPEPETVETPQPPPPPDVSPAPATPPAQGRTPQQLFEQLQQMRQQQQPQP